METSAQFNLIGALTVEAEVREHLARTIHREERRRSGLSANADDEMAAWIRLALPDYLGVAHKLKPTLGFLSAVGDPVFLGVLLTPRLRRNVSGAQHPLTAPTPARTTLGTSTSSTAA
jgi:hypothetical protein